MTSPIFYDGKTTTASSAQIDFQENIVLSLIQPKPALSELSQAVEALKINSFFKIEDFSFSPICLVVEFSFL